MKRILTYRITEEDENSTIDRYLRSLGYSHHILTHLKRTENGILINGARARTTALLQSGNCLCITLEDTERSSPITPVELPLIIVYEDEDLLVLNKAPDMPVHPSIHNHENTLANGLSWYYQQQGLPFVFRCINRLDRDTSGLLIVAKNMLSANILSTDMRRRCIHRNYLAIVSGCLRGNGSIEAPIARKEGSLLERCVNFETGETAITHYAALSYHKEQNITLISLQLETGRTHQIRVHMQYLGYPLIGDYLYLTDTSLISRQALHSQRLEFIHPIQKIPLCFEAPLPEDMGCLFP